MHISPWTTTIICYAQSVFTYVFVSVRTSRRILSNSTVNYYNQNTCYCVPKLLLDGTYMCVFYRTVHTFVTLLGTYMCDFYRTVHTFVTLLGAYMCVFSRTVHTFVTLLGTYMCVFFTGQFILSWRYLGNTCAFFTGQFILSWRYLGHTCAFFTGQFILSWRYLGNTCAFLPDSSYFRDITFILVVLFTFVVWPSLHKNVCLRSKLIFIN